MVSVRQRGGGNRMMKIPPSVVFLQQIADATAIGFAQQEGILSVDEKIVDIFPELLPEHPSEYLKKITLHHLLIMGCGHETEISDNSENWISTFLHHPVLHEPGTFL